MYILIAGGTAMDGGWKEQGKSEGMGVWQERGTGGDTGGGMYFSGILP